MITLFGATGYTGSLVARALDRDGLPFRIAGRSAAKLSVLSADLSSRPATLVADVRRPDTLGSLYAGTRLLINCAGPFTDLGEPVVARAAARGVHYLDITNELAYVYRLRQYDALARTTSAAIVPACGFEVAIADCVAAQLGADLPKPIDEIEVTYAWGTRGVSIGTRLSAARTLATSWLAYRDGRYVTQAPGAATRQITINNRIVCAIAFPSSEIVTLPSHLDVRNVTVWLAISRRVARLAPIVVPALSGLMRTPLGGLAAQILKRGGPPPSAGQRAADRFAIKVAARHGTETRSQTVTGRDPYGVTAEMASHAARAMTTDGYSQSGVLAPSQAIDPDTFLEWLKARIGG
jgi:short subunit dehydrogenase-like uncharacterized protein